MLLEVAVDGLDGVKAARAGGADRIELCAGLAEGGLTPGVGLLRGALRLCGGALPVVVMIRPRPGGFVYDADDLAAMLAEVASAKAEGAAGVALGALDRDGGLDLAATAALVEAARPLAVTFHRAFDLVADQHGALGELAALGVERVLTSGGAPTAAAGAGRLRELVRASAGRVVVLPGGGIRPGNAAALARATGAAELHLSGAGWRDDGPAGWAALALGPSGPAGQSRRSTDPGVLRAVRSALGG